jgi:dephospho-CoA kinase
VVEGVRHLKAVEELRLLAEPSRFVLVYIDTPEECLLKRLPEKGIADVEALRQFEAHITEADVTSNLKNVADLVLDGTQQVDDLVKQTAAYVRRAL